MDTSKKYGEMKITGLEIKKCGAGFRDFCFVKITTDGFMETTNGKKPIVGWAEYLEERNIGLRQVIEWMGQLIVDLDPLPYMKIITQLKANTRHVPGGIAGQAIGAIENALLDVVGKAYGVPVCMLFGGPIRTELPVYWSHCGSFRLSYSDMLQNPHTKVKTPPIRNMDDVKMLCKEVKESGHKSLKTNIFIFEKDKDTGTDKPAIMYMPGFGGGIGSPELNLSHDLLSTIVNQMRTFREECGDDIGLRLDLNYNFKTEGFCAIAAALSPEALNGRGLDWLELDIMSPQALRRIRDKAAMPIASLESLLGRKAIMPYLEAEAVDVCIIDPLWNGVDESVKMAELCDLYEVNCAAHNYHGWLGTAMCAHFCAAIPNFKILEVDVDDVAWKDDIVTVVPQICDGVLSLPMGPGWGVDINEEILEKYPPIADNAKSGIWSSAGEN
eukprot:m.42879 g.42879  ORF g.42879 m.42879 type:complete len:442 (+) comp9924_c0_seq2:162-1487(+)